jgi:hypothetical protein
LQFRYLLHATELRLSESPVSNSKGFSAVAHNSHKRETNARRLPRAGMIAGPLAFLATATAVTVGVLASEPADVHLIATSSTPADLTADRGFSVSRSAPRAALSAAPRAGKEIAPPSRAELMLSRTATQQAIAKADTRLWTTAPLNLWDAPGEQAELLGELESATRVLVTGRSLFGRDEVVVDGSARWVTKGYLSDEKPLGVGAGLSDAPCPDGSVENGLTANAVLVYRSVCHAFPQITSYGGWDAHGEHASGRAIDIMTSDKTLGDAIADFLHTHAAELHLYDIIWWDQIWTPVRAAEGWRAYGDHGSATANHMDHVHVSTY